MTLTPEPHAEDREILLGIDLRERAERLINAAEAFSAAAVALRRWAIVGLVVGVVILASIAGLFLATRASVNSGHEARDKIVDCVDPGGKCYQRSQAETAHLLDVLNRQNIAQGVCLQEYAAQKPLTARDASVTRCVAGLTG